MVPIISVPTYCLIFLLLLSEAALAVDNGGQGCARH